MNVMEKRMPARFKTPRDWDRATIARAHDTRHMTRMGGGHGNAGSLTFSIPLGLSTQFLTRYCMGRETVHVRLEQRGTDELLLLPTKPNEAGRKFSLSNGGKDYRAFFDGANYPWISSVEPFGSTYTDARIADGGILMRMPSVEERTLIQPYVQYTPRRRPHVYPPNKPLIERPLLSAPTKPAEQMYVIVVPPEIDERFNALMRLLKLECVKV